MPLLPPTLVLEHPIWACLGQSNLEEFHPLPWGGFVLQTQPHNVWTVSALAVSRLEHKNRRKMKRGSSSVGPASKSQEASMQMERVVIRQCDAGTTD